MPRTYMAWMCWLTAERTSSSSRLNSSKQPQPPVRSRPVKMRPIDCRRQHTLVMAKRINSKAAGLERHAAPWRQPNHPSGCCPYLLQPCLNQSLSACRLVGEKAASFAMISVLNCQRGPCTTTKRRWSSCKPINQPGGSRVEWRAACVRAVERQKQYLAK